MDKLGQVRHTQSMEETIGKVGGSSLDQYRPFSSMLERISLRLMLKSVLVSLKFIMNRGMICWMSVTRILITENGNRYRFLKLKLGKFKSTNSNKFMCLMKNKLLIYSLKETIRRKEHQLQWILQVDPTLFSKSELIRQTHKI